MILGYFEKINAALSPYPWLHGVLALVLLGALAWLANWVTKKILLRALRHLLQSLLPPEAKDRSPFRHGVVPRLANVVPAIVLMSGMSWVPHLPTRLVTLTNNLGGAFIILTIALAIAKLLDMVSEAYHRRQRTQHRSIKGYVQLVKLILFLIAAILMVAVLIERSPLLLLSGMGAMMAVLILVFQDTLLSLVAGVMIGSNDMIRVGDWIEMPAVGADGDVIDISLHTIKVQNWDKTISAIPMKRFLSDSFRNWRGMQEAGGRRIKRALYLDQTSVHFLSEEEIQRLQQLRLLEPYLSEKQQELSHWNESLGAWAEKDPANQRRLTNLGSFRAYTLRYLQAHPGIHQGLSLIVRQLQPGATGLPLELYCFTTDTTWATYENVQSDIFDHLLAVLPQFGLRVFQGVTGHDLRSGIRSVMASPASLPMAELTSAAGSQQE